MTARALWRGRGVGRGVAAGNGAVFHTAVSIRSRKSVLETLRPVTAKGFRHDPVASEWA